MILYWFLVLIQYNTEVLCFFHCTHSVVFPSTELQSSSRYRAAIPGTTHLCRCHTWSTSTPLCQHQSPRSTLFQTFHHRQPSFSSCCLTNLELTTRNSRFSINTAVVPAPTENFYCNDPLFSSTEMVVSQ